MVVRDGLTGDQIRNTFMGTVAAPEGLVKVEDLNASGDPELAALGDSTDSPGTVRAQIKDSISGAAVSVVDFP